MRGRIWITWERQRRSMVLSEHFDCRFFEIIETGLLRYPKVIARTLWVLFCERPDVLVVQNPSMILAAIGVAWGMVTTTYVVVDRHSTFLLNRIYSLTPWLALFKSLNRFTLRFADLTIVTNAFLADLVAQGGGRPYVLPDKLPTLSAAARSPFALEADVRNVFLIGSFADDEPISEVFDALAQIDDAKVHVFVSGSRKKAPESLLRRAPASVTFTDYLSDSEFSSLLHAVDLVAVLTTADHTMLCGCYEAVAAGQPLVTSDKQVLREYFDGAFFVDNTPSSIAVALRKTDDELNECKKRIVSLGAIRRDSWNAQADAMASLLDCPE
jgi:hypothetical protein